MKNSTTIQMLLENPITALLFSENKNMEIFPNIPIVSEILKND